MTTKVLIVDDSSFMRAALRQIVESDKTMEVVGVAADGEEAVRKVKQLQPHVVLLDILMPVMDGLTALAHIMAERPTPVVMLSGLEREDATVAIKSLEHGAVDFIAKPSGTVSYDIEKIAGEIRAKLKLAAGVDVRKMALRLPPAAYRLKRHEPPVRRAIAIIGASTGGPRALVRILSKLPADFPAAMLVVQHMTAEFVPLLVERLRWICSLQIDLAQPGEVLAPGRVLVAPGSRHTVIAQDSANKKIAVSERGTPHALRPCIDHAMESAARAYGESALGVLLTGSGRDGAQGLKAIKEAGGATIAEDQATCVVPSMPKAAIELGCVDAVVPLPHIAENILRMVGEQQNV